MKLHKLKWMILNILILFIGVSGLIIGSRKLPPENYTILTDKKILSNNYISEKNYAETMTQVVEPRLNDLVAEHTLTLPDNISIYYRSYKVPNPKGTIVISHGFSEWLDKYNELIYYFTQNGYSVYIPSHRGHGLSTRLVSDLSMVHTEDFDDYVEDLHYFVQEVVTPEAKDSPLILFGHSMGGGIATLFLERYPNIMDAAILSSPMLEVKLPGIPSFLAEIVANVYDGLGKGEEYVFTQGPFEGTPAFESSSTQAEERYMYYFNKRTSGDYYHTEGGSFSWLKESLGATHHMAKNADLITIPVLLYQAELDELVKPGGQNYFIKKAPNAEMVFVPGAKHDLYFEKDSILFPYLDKLFDFLNAL